MNDLDLTGKVALVTGASRGIGRSIALALAASGATVVASARVSEHLDDVVREIEAMDVETLAIPADLAQDEQIRNLFDTIEQTYGKLDICINNAGIGHFGPVIDFSLDDFDAVMAVNVRGTFLCCQAAMQMMVPCKSGYIINVSSVVGTRGYANQSAYTASKHGIMGLTKSLAVEAQPHNIRVSAILPGGVDTDMARASRPDLPTDELLAPDDVAQSVLFLLSLSERAAIDEIYIRRKNSKPF
jgi:3-oxoacyl-[acyl-carrier protein] reductase